MGICIDYDQTTLTNLTNVVLGLLKVRVRPTLFRKLKDVTHLKDDCNEEKIEVEDSRKISECYVASPVAGGYLRGKQTHVKTNTKLLGGHDLNSDRSRRIEPNPDS